MSTDKRQIKKEGKDVKMVKKIIYSVETAENNYNDDLFNGTLEECINYIEDFDLEISSECRIAKIVLDSDGIVIDTLDIFNQMDEIGNAEWK